MTRALTPEQAEIKAQFLSHSCLIVEAGPGCGKSTTLGWCAATIPTDLRAQTKATAFNKDAVAALDGKLPAGLHAKTINAMGYEIWRATVPFCKVNLDKTKELIAAIRSDGRYSIAPDEYMDVISLVSMAKSQGYIPPKSGAIPLANPPSFQDICNLADVRANSYLNLILDLILSMSIKASFEGDIDLDDQIYMSALFAPFASYPKTSILIVDEAQDLTPLQLRLLQRLKSPHNIFVGDPLQAIYGFRGAMSNAMAQIKTFWPEAKTLPLQTSFRIPQSVCRLLQSHNPLLTTAKSDEGQILQPVESNTIDKLIPSDTVSRAILCRNNAPLYRVALACIASQVPYRIGNNGFGSQLIRLIKKAGSQTTPAIRIVPLVGQLISDEDPAKSDKLAALALMAERCSTAKEMIDEITKLNAQGNKSVSAKPLFLSTAHKAKGLEFQWVAHLDSFLIPAKYATTPDQLQQEANIAYVINSRALQSLVFLNSDQITIPGSSARKGRPTTSYNQPV